MSLHNSIPMIEEEIMTQPRGYVDPHYLRILAELLQQDKQRTYSWMHIQPSHAVLDVGCGPGTDTIALAELVGPTGCVVGVDYDAGMIAEAGRRAAQAGCSAWSRHQQGDASALPLETDTFDSSRSERLFQHLRDPADALAEMARVTKPGGWVVVLDADHSTLSIDTSEVDIERRLARARTERSLNNGYAGRQLYRLFKRQHFTDITVEIRPVYFTSYVLARYSNNLDVVEHDALVAGLVTEEELQRWRQSLEQAEEAGEFFAHINTILVAGRKQA